MRLYIILFSILCFSSSVQAQYFELRKKLDIVVVPQNQKSRFEFESKKIELYFGKEHEAITHFSIHFLLGLWRADYSIVAAFAIEISEAVNGRFELDDLLTRLSGCLSAYIFKKYLLSGRTGHRGCEFRHYLDGETNRVLYTVGLRYIMAKEKLPRS